MLFTGTQVSGVCRNFPQILEALSEGRLHLTGASLIAPHLTEENVEGLITTSQGKTKRQIEELLVRLKPKEKFAPSIRKKPSNKNTMPGENSQVPAEEEPSCEAKASGLSGGKSTDDTLEPATEERYNFRFSAAKEFLEKFKRLAEVLGIEDPHNHMEEIFEQTLDIALEKKDPKRKLERRRKREEKKQSPCAGKHSATAKHPDNSHRTDSPCAGKQNTGPAENSPCPGKPGKGEKNWGKPSASRHVPSEVREPLWKRKAVPPSRLE